MEEKYKNNSGSVGWSCPSNIALIKYWGKRPVQIPMNPSLSMTLEVARTRTRLEFDYDPQNQNPTLHYQFEGRLVPSFENRIKEFIGGIVPYIPVLSHTSLRIESENTFPHSSGIASSASSMGALALCLVAMENKITDHSHPIDKEKASYIARLGSGSACRSVYPGFALWGATDEWAGSNNEYALPVTSYHNDFNQLRDAILIVDSGVKKVSSSQGHLLMNTNPFSKTRILQANQNLITLKSVLDEGDWDGFISLMELEALSLHSMMMTSKPPYILMKPGTLSIIHKVRAFRNDTRCNVGFTLDAGPNVHLIYSHRDSDKVTDFITTELVPFCEEGKLIMDQMGKGPLEL